MMPAFNLLRKLGIVVTVPLFLHGGTVSGSVRLSDSRDPEVRKHRDYSGVVVWLLPANGSAAPRPISARMEQKGKRFIPHVLAVTAGSRVSFPNLDPIFHSAFSNFSGQVFDLGLYPPKTSKTVAFTRAGVVRVFCNIHPTMSAVIVVLQSSWFAVSDAGGGFAIPGVPPGEYTLRVFHERATEKTLLSLARKVRVESDGLDLPALVISETGYVETPHKNKYGREYPPPSANEGPYGGAAAQ